MKKKEVTKENLEKALLEAWLTALLVKDRGTSNGIISTCKTIADEFGLTISNTTDDLIKRDNN